MITGEKQLWPRSTRERAATVDKMVPTILFKKCRWSSGNSALRYTLLTFSSAADNRVPPERALQKREQSTKYLGATTLPTSLSQEDWSGLFSSAASSTGTWRASQTQDSSNQRSQTSFQWNGEQLKQQDNEKIEWTLMLSPTKQRVN